MVKLTPQDELEVIMRWHEKRQFDNTVISYFCPETLHYDDDIPCYGPAWGHIHYHGKSIFFPQFKKWGSHANYGEGYREEIYDAWFFNKKTSPFMDMLLWTSEKYGFKSFADFEMFVREVGFPLHEDIHKVFHYGAAKAMTIAFRGPKEHFCKNLYFRMLEDKEVDLPIEFIFWFTLKFRTSTASPEDDPSYYPSIVNHEHIPFRVSAKWEAVKPFFEGKQVINEDFDEENYPVYEAFGTRHSLGGISKKEFQDLFVKETKPDGWGGKYKVYYEGVKGYNNIKKIAESMYKGECK